MVEISVPTLLGLKETGNGTYKPRFISMFPPSYAQRALARHVRRQAIRDVASIAPPPAPEPNTAPGPAPPAEEAPKPAERISSRNQTDVSYCYHECASHPFSSTPNTLGGGGAGKKGDKGKGKQQQQEKGKKKDSATAAADEDAASDQGSEDEDNPDSQKKQKDKDKGKQQGKKKEGKEAKEGKDSKDGKESKDKIDSPPLFPLTPFYGHPYPGSLKYHPVLKQPGWSFEQSLATARRADENYIGQWLMEKGAPFQLGAMNWLEEREKQRRAQVTHSFPTGTSKHVTFAEPIDAGRPSLMPPFGAYGFGSTMAPYSQPPARQGEPFVIYQDGNTSFRTADGREVQVLSGNGPGMNEPPRMSGALQQTSGNRGPPPQPSGPPDNSRQGPGWQRPPPGGQGWGPGNNENMLPRNQGGFGGGNDSGPPPSGWNSGNNGGPPPSGFNSGNNGGPPSPGWNSGNNDGPSGDQPGDNGGQGWDSGENTGPPWGQSAGNDGPGWNSGNNDGAWGGWDRGSNGRNQGNYDDRNRNTNNNQGQAFNNSGGNRWGSNDSQGPGPNNYGGRWNSNDNPGQGQGQGQGQAFNEPRWNSDNDQSRWNDRNAFDNSNQNASGNWGPRNNTAEPVNWN